MIQENGLYIHIYITYIYIYMCSFKSFVIYIYIHCSNTRCMLSEHGEHVVESLGTCCPNSKDMLLHHTEHFVRTTREQDVAGGSAPHHQTRLAPRPAHFSRYSQCLDNMFWVFAQHQYVLGVMATCCIQDHI